MRLSHTRMPWQFIRSESKWLQRMLLQIDIAKLHTAPINALNPDDKLATAQLQDQDVSFMARSRSDKRFATGNVYSANRQLLNRLLERRLISGNRFLSRLDLLISLLWLTRSNNWMLGDKRKTLEGTANRHSKRIGGTSMN